MLWSAVTPRLVKATRMNPSTGDRTSNVRTIWIADAHRDNGRRLRVQVSNRMVWIDQTFLQKG